MPTHGLDMRGHAVAERQSMALELRESGLGYNEIAVALGYTVNGRPVAASARRAAAAALARRGSAGRRFGVEIEFNGITKSEAYDALLNAGINVRDEGYNHRTRNYWKLTYDASVNSRGCQQAYGHELVSPPLSGEDGYATMATALDALREAGGSVDRTCGIHVHHDMLGLNGTEISTFARLFYRAQDSIDLLVAPSRRFNSGYTRRLLSNEIGDIVQHFTAYRTAPYVDRYRSLNCQSFPKYGTMEIRQHQGTLVPAKLGAWVKLGQSLVQAAVDGVADEIADEFFPDHPCADSYHLPEFDRLAGRLESMVSALPGMTADDNQYLLSRASLLASR